MPQPHRTTLCLFLTITLTATASTTYAAAPAAPKVPFDGKRAYGYLKQLCAFGNRKSGSPGMQQQQALLERHFIALGGKVSWQKFPARDPHTGQSVPMANLIVEWWPEATERILLCAHYDTRPFPDRELIPMRRKGVFLGANDGASGVAVLMELAHHMQLVKGTLGVDFVLFDGEELVYQEGDPYFLGSERFATQYNNSPPAHRYVAGVLMDMVGDAKLTLYQEGHSMSWPESRQVANEIWGTAQRLGIKEFIPRVKYTVQDDHLPLNRIAKIPTCDLIDFEYPNGFNSFWHTQNDAPGRCSADSLGKVGTVLGEWLVEK